MSEKSVQSEKINNPYLHSFNENFGFNLILVKNENLDEEIPGNPPFSLGVISGGRYKDAPEYFCEDFSIIPVFQSNSINDLPLLDDFTEKEIIRFQLVGYKHYSGNRNNPPETADFVIGNYPNIDVAIKTACGRLLSEKLSDVWISVQENEMLDEEFGGFMTDEENN